MLGNHRQAPAVSEREGVPPRRMPANNYRSMDRLSKKVARAAEALKHPGPYRDPESEKTAVIDTKLLIAFWSCCQLER
jgi:hypothetical protein